ncbi:MAG: ATP-binding protein [Candidatus Fusobacterium pullicola]|uniref:ATP-binding protein n=2 Tax=Fusobacterium TaxID=848 RepID=A0A9E2KZK5_9FUSO|nr:ATP-binding protein [Candidatus Fusobacterium pullicola]
MKKVPIAIEDFREVRGQDCYYVDKTKFIEDILNDGSEVKLFCRPRRFGKTLNMSMLKYFFNIENKDENRELFNSLYIENSPMMKEQGKYPVIFISMKGITASTWEGALKNIRDKIFKLYNEYDGKINHILTENENKIFNKFAGKESDEEELKTALSFLTSLLYKYYNQKVIVLIDEYDSPIISAYEKRYYNEMRDFLRAFYGDVLKTNNYLKMGILTGIIRVAQAGIFSDLNNFTNYTILNNEYSDCFGLVESEVKAMLDYYSIGYEMPEVKSWYNGYSFGENEIYNPWSILKYVQFKKVKSYWVNTSGNALILNMLLASNSTVFDNLNDLINGKDIMVYINESIRMGDNLSPNNIWEIMLFSGYLTVKETLSETMFVLRIPNKEIQSLFKGLFVDAIFRESSNVGSLVQALITKNISQVIKSLEDVVINAISFYDISRKYENPYQALLGGFLYALDDYYIMDPNMESGYGRADIILIPRNKSWAGYILELKRANTNDIEKEAEKAFNQIEDKKYEALLKKNGVKDIVKIGIVFDGKKAVAYY